MMKTDQNRTKWEIGLDGGANLTQTIKGHFHEDAERLKEIKLGFFVGMFLQYNLNSHFSLSTNINFESKIIAEKITIFNQINNRIEDMPYRHQLNYLTLPLYARYYIKKSGLFVNVGTSLDFLLKCEYTYWDYFLNKNMKIDNTEYSAKFNLDIIAGLGINIPVNKKCNLSFELRDNLGFLDINHGGTVIKINSILFLYSMTYNIGNKKLHK